MPTGNPTKCPECGEMKFYSYPWGGLCRYCSLTVSVVIDIELLRRLRIEKANWSAEGLAVTVGRSRSQIYTYERGAQLPSLKTFRDICVGMELTSEEVFKLLRLDNDQNISR